MTPEDEEHEIVETTSRILGSFDRARENLIPILQKMQRELGYIPKRGMVKVAEALGISVGEVFGVTTFYNQFRLNPPGKYQIKVCMGTACHVKRSYIILEEWSRRLGIQEGETTEDRLFSLERVACVGCCALAPVTVIDHEGDEQFHGYMMTSKVNGLIMSMEREEGKEEDERGKGSLRADQHKG